MLWQPAHTERQIKGSYAHSASTSLSTHSSAPEQAQLHEPPHDVSSVPHDWPQEGHSPHVGACDGVMVRVGVTEGVGELDRLTVDVGVTLIVLVCDAVAVGVLLSDSVPVGDWLGVSLSDI
jgi:hypothetical protein